MFPKEKTQKYIQYFQNNNQSFYSNEGSYVSYDETVNTFIQDCYDYNVMDTEYMDKVYPFYKKNANLENLIKTADISMIKSILTFYIRGERFNEGMIAEAIDNKILLNVLIRLNNIKE